MTGNIIREARKLAFDELYRISQTESSLAIDESFPEQFADQLSRQEVFNKHLFRPNTYLHKWWARRCGSIFRTILKQFVPDPKRRDYYAPGGLEGKIVLDPMMGRIIPSIAKSPQETCNFFSVIVSNEAVNGQ